MIVGEGFPIVAPHTLPALSADQMAQVDRLAVEEFDLLFEQMVEHAGSHLAEVVHTELRGTLTGRRVVVAAGPGNNGAGGLAAARHLANRGASVNVVLARPAVHLSPGGQRQLGTLLQMRVDCGVAIYDLGDADIERELARADCAVDAVLGYRVAGALRDGAEWLVGHLVRAGTPVISLDIPTGVDPDSGRAGEPAITAQATMTLALPKTGLLNGDGPSHAGRLYLADIGLPEALYERLGIDIGTPFSEASILRLQP